MFARENLVSAQRIVVKVGTSTLTYPNGKLNLDRIDKLARELSDIRNQGKQVILVTSGAVGVGMDRLGFSERPKTIPGKQAAAAVGQGILMHIYEKMFGEYGQIVAQVLLTRADSVNSKRYANSRNALMALLNQGVIPIINENDVVAIDELKIGDNDNLSAIVSSIVDADVLIILSDVSGLYTANPQQDPEAKLISCVSDITPEIEGLAKGAGSMRAVGGMHTKIQAAKIATNSGVTMIIALGSQYGTIRGILDGQEIGTVFVPKQAHSKIRKRWLAYGAKTSSKIIVDAGCEKALISKGSSVLAAGITKIEGSFEQGDIIKVVCVDGREIARGISNYSSEDIKKIMGVKTDSIAGILGSKPCNEVIHRDNMVLLV